MTFSSQNFGAKEYDRCKKVYRICIACGMAITFLMSMTFVLLRTYVIRFYTGDVPVIEYALIRMVHVELFTCIPVTYEVTGAALRGIGYSMLPAILTVFGSCALRILWVYTVFQQFGSFEMLMNVYPVTWVVTGIMVVTAYFIMRRKAFR